MLCTAHFETSHIVLFSELPFPSPISDWIFSPWFLFLSFIPLVQIVPWVVQLLNQQPIPSYSFLYFIFLTSNELGTVSFVCLFLKRELVNWQCHKTIKRLCPLLLYIIDPCFTGYPNPLLYQSIRASKEKWAFCIANSFLWLTVNGPYY